MVEHSTVLSGDMHLQVVVVVWLIGVIDLCWSIVNNLNRCSFYKANSYSTLLQPLSSYQQRSQSLFCSSSSLSKDLSVAASKAVLGRQEKEVDEISLPALQVIAKTGRLGANLGYFYLQKELKLSEHHMVQIMEKYPWIMYLRVDTNLRPTVEVLKSFGFRDKDVRSMLQTVPPILGINHEWTLPEKLISIQKMFNLNRAGLVKLVVDQPFLLTCSIDRNIKVSEFLSETVGLSPESIRNCLLCCPEVAMSGITKMAACWSVLTDIYGLSDKQARALIENYPIVLTHRTLKTIQDKVSFFSGNNFRPYRHIILLMAETTRLLCALPNVLFDQIERLVEHLTIKSSLPSTKTTTMTFKNKVDTIKKFVCKHKDL